MLTLLIACILFELFVGIIIIYIGNLHYYQNASGVDVVCGTCCLPGAGGLFDCLVCCCRCCARGVPRSASAVKRHGNYLSVQTAAGGGGAVGVGGAGLGGERSDGNAALHAGVDLEMDDEWTSGSAGRRRRFESEGTLICLFLKKVMYVRSTIENIHLV